MKPERDTLAQAQDESVLSRRQSVFLSGMFLFKIFESWLKQNMIRRSFLAISICFVGPLLQIQTAWAATERVVIEIPIYGQLIYSQLTAQAESMVRDSINRYFAQADSQSAVEVVVLGDRYGEVVPILTTAVSKVQWQQNPQVSAWTQHYSASQALLERFDDDSQLAQLPAQPSYVGSTASGFQDHAAQTLQVEAAFQEGRLTPQEYTELIDALD